MNIAPLAEVKARLSAYVDKAETEGPVIITRNGKAVAVLIAPNDEADLEHLVLTRSPKFQAILEESRQSLAAGKGLPASELWKAARQRGRGKPSAK